jgi:hypothetical protein
MGWLETAIRQRMPVSLGVNLEDGMGRGSALPPGGDDVIGRLERLGVLRDTGVITTDEFEVQKRRILGERATSYDVQNGRVTST